MNYYEHHIGDYAQATAHLTFVEDAAYNRLLRKYYAEEKPIPADLRAAQRLVAARTREERDAVETVLNEFFTLETDGWHNKRADAEIARYSAKRNKARLSAEARWAATNANANASESESGRSANASETHNGRNALQTPDTSLHTQKDQGQESTASPSTDLLGLAPPADLKSARALRLAQVTDEAISSFNASPLVKPNGGLLATISARVGREKRQQQVSKCLRVAKDICVETYGSQTITPEFWVDYWAACQADEHKSGRRGGGKDHPNWKPTFEYLTREATMLEVYDRATEEDAA